MTLPTNDQKFVMNDVPLNKLQDVESSLKEGGCINIGHKPGGNGYTVTALCPIHDDVQNDTIDGTE